jgi:hypothetical protein
LSGAASSSQLTTRPSLLRSIRPASSSTCRCFMNPGSDMPCGAASSLTACPPLPASEFNTARRVGSASAAKTLSSASSEYLTIEFSILYF